MLVSRIQNVFKRLIHHSQLLFQISKTITTGTINQYNQTPQQARREKVDDHINRKDIRHKKLKK